MAWSPAEVENLTLIGSMIITVQNIQNVWMINIHTMDILLTGKLIWKCCEMYKFRHIYISNIASDEYSRLIWESTRKYAFINYFSGRHFSFVFIIISVNLNSTMFQMIEFSKFLFKTRVFVSVPAPSICYFTKSTYL